LPQSRDIGSCVGTSRKKEDRCTKSGGKRHAKRTVNPTRVSLGKCSHKSQVDQQISVVWKGLREQSGGGGDLSRLDHAHRERTSAGGCGIVEKLAAEEKRGCRQKAARRMPAFRERHDQEDQRVGRTLAIGEGFKVADV